MIIGVPKEIKTGEQRVALTPAGVQALVDHGHQVLIEPGAGVGSGFRDDDYTQLGAGLKPADAVWAEADLVLKVKEPIRAEYPRLRAKQILFTYLHLAAVPELTRALAEGGHHRDRVRDGAARRREPAAPHADERGGGPAVGAGGRLPPGQGARRPGHPALGRPRRAAGQRGDPRRRHRRSQRAQDCRRPGRRRVDPRREPGPAAPRRRHLPGPGRHAGLERSSTSPASPSAPTSWWARSWSPAPARRSWSRSRR